MSSDVVRLTVDWGPRSGDPVATSKPVYVIKPTTAGWDKINVYAWKDEKVNAAWPGVEMVESYQSAGGTVYELSIPNDMERVIFNNGNTASMIKLVEDDIVLADTEYNSGTGKVFFDPSTSKWTTKPEKQAVSTISAIKTPAATSVPEDVDLVEAALTPIPAGNKKAYKLNLAAGDTVEFKDGNTTIHFYHWDEATEKAVDDGTVFTATLAGLYEFYYNNNDQMFVSTSAKAYYLVGKFGGVDKWDITTNVFELYDAVANEYKFTITLAAGDKIKAMSNTKDYFPAGSGNEYTVEEAGSYDVYFRPNGNGNNDWYESYLYVAPAE